MTVSSYSVSRSAPWSRTRTASACVLLRADSSVVAGVNTLFCFAADLEAMVAICVTLKSARLVSQMVERSIYFVERQVKLFWYLDVANICI